MSHLRAPAARADRREGGRHGRPVARAAPRPAETHIRSHLLRLAVLPPVAVALGASAVVLFTVRTSGVPLGPPLWIVLAGAVIVALAGIVIAAVAADRAARSVHHRIGTLRRSSARGVADLRTLVEALRRGDGPPAPRPRGRPTPDADGFDLLAEDLAAAHEGAFAAVVQAARLSSRTGSEQKVEVFVNLARRLQSLVHREISILDDLENQIEDPDLLKGLFHVDHLATRIRRHAENLAVLGGAVSRRQWSNPVSMTEVLRSATAEVEQYSRVRLVPPIGGTVRGHAVADVIHLLAELVENATVFSAPHTQVLLRADVVTSGLAVEVEDRGLGMPPSEQHKMNALLADPDQVNVASLLQDGRIGLFVVSQLARRHGIAVRLQTNIYGGVQAVLVVPQALLGAADEPPGGAHRAAPPGGVPVDGTPGPVPSPQGRPGPPPSARRAPRHGAPAPATSGRATPLQGTLNQGTTARHGVPSAQGTHASGPPGHEGGAGEEPAARGTPAQGAASPGAPARGTPAHGRPAHGVSSGGAPVPGAPAQGAPSRAAPVHAVPAHGTPSQGVPARGVTAAAPASPQPWAGTPGGPTAVNGGGGPVPLPVRRAEARANPAEAVPGIRPDDRRTVAENTRTPPTPRDETVLTGVSRPRLPRRRAQEHLVPELRGGPAPRQESGPPAGHDPGLMAAFQRGIGLAETRCGDVEPWNPALTEPTPREPAPTVTPAPAESSHGGYGPAHGTPVPGHDRTARHDGSTPAG